MSEVCEAYGKAVHATEATATAAMAETLANPARVTKPGEPRAYSCDACGGWHWGHFRLPAHVTEAPPPATLGELFPERAKQARKIDTPGVYDVDMDRYHSDLCDGPSLSSGDLVALTRNPRKWFAHHWSNPKRFPKPDTGALAFGRAAHCLVVGGESFRDNYAVRPAVRYPDYKTKAAREWRDRKAAEGRTVVTSRDMRTIKAMARAIRHSPEALSIFEAGRPEQTLIWRRDGVWLKARPDVIPVQDARIVCDYKTVRSVEPRKLRRDIHEFGYAQKLANVAEGLTATVPTGAESLADYDFALICQEKSAPFEVVVVTIHHSYIAEYMRVNHAALAEYKASVASGDWRGANDGFLEYSPDDWVWGDLSKRWGGPDALPPYPDLFPQQEQFS